MDALQEAREAMEWAEDESLNADAAPWYFAKAVAYAAIAQAEQLKRIADEAEKNTQINAQFAAQHERAREQSDAAAMELPARIVESLERIAESLERALPVLGRIAAGLEEPLP